GSAPWLLRQFNLGNSSSAGVTVSSSPSPLTPSSEPVSPTHTTSEQPSGVPEEAPSLSLPPVTKNEENCTLKKDLEDLEDALWSTGISDFDPFIKVVCTNTNKNTSSPIPTQWEGLFPNSLLKNRTELTYEKKFEIKTQTESLGETNKYKTTFSGSHFYDDVVGEWTKNDPFEGEKEMAEMIIVSSRSSSEKIYLLLKK
ncbi:hypothetical protein DNK47_02445, partial [Mycoplasma wenyonii]